MLEEESDGVRMMTVHGAKGLEFPVVILADLTTSISRDDPEQWVDGERRLAATRLLGCAPQELLDHEAEEAARDLAEGMRVAYVAATRARDLLVIPAVGDEEYPQPGWLKPFYKALFPAQADFRASRPAMGCPEFGPASVVERPLDYDRQPEFSVRPGLITPRSGSHEVVWWDPSKLKLGEEGDFGLRQEKILEKDDGASLDAYRQWQQQREAAISAGSVPEFDVFVASQASEAPPGDAIPVEIATPLEPAPGAATSSGRRFGVLVHGVLRDVPLDGGATAIRQLAELHGRLLGAPADEMDAACAAVASALEHPLLHRARTAEACHREYPVTLRLDSGKLFDGVIDLAFVEAGGWVVVDFKTDADWSAHRARYERQLQWYAYTLARLTGMAARAYLLPV